MTTKQDWFGIPRNILNENFIINTKVLTAKRTLKVSTRYFQQFVESAIVSHVHILLSKISFGTRLKTKKRVARSTAATVLCVSRRNSRMNDAM